jgi:hypothetical protein
LTFYPSNLKQFKPTSALTLLLTSTMHILIAPNAFKNKPLCNDAAEAIQQGLQQSGLPCTTQCFPNGDGGDGTADLLSNT